MNERRHEHMNKAGGGDFNSDRYVYGTHIRMVSQVYVYLQFHQVVYTMDVQIFCVIDLNKIA